MRLHSAAFLCLAMLPCANLHARVWKSIEGETLEAEFISADRLTVKLQVGQSTPTLYSLTGFCREDQIYIHEQMALRLAKPPAELSVRAAVEWGSLYNSGAESKTEPVLNVTLAAQGPSIANAGRAGDLQIDAFETDAPTPLKLSDSTGGLNGKLTHVNKRPLVPLPHGMYYLLQFTPNDQPLTRIRRLKGSYKITTGEPYTIIVKKILHAEEVEVSDPLLKELGLKMIVNAHEPPLTQDFGPDTQSFSLSVCGLPGRILDVSWTDPAGRRYCGFNESSSSWQNDAVLDDRSEDRGNECFLFTQVPPAPQDLELRITVLTNPREERISFDLTDLEVPARPKAPPERVGAERSQVNVQKVHPQLAFGGSRRIARTYGYRRRLARASVSRAHGNPRSAVRYR